MARKLFVVFSRNNDPVLVCPIGRIDPPTIAIVGNELGMTNPASRFVRDFQELVGEVVVEFRDPPTDDARFGDAPWVGSAVEEGVHAIVRDAVAAAFGIVIPDHAPIARALAA